MRFLHTGDWHVGKTLRGRSRADEHRAVLDEMATIARERKVDIVLIAGDLFDTASPTSESEAIVYRALLDLAHASEWVVVISGNHDNPRRLAAVEPLMRLTNIRVLPSIARPDDGGVLTLQTKVGGARIALLPFLSQRLIVKADDLMMKDAGEHVSSYAEHAHRIIQSLCADKAPPQTVDILLAHAMVHGGVLGGGERQAHTVFEYSIPTTAFPATLHYTALGHLHRVQKIPGACPIWYSGSPLQLDFGETRDAKSVNIIEAEPGRPATVECVPLVSGRRLRFIKTTMERLIEVVAEAGDDYLRVEIDAPPTPGLANEVREMLPNAVDVQLATPHPASKDEAPTPRRIGRSPRELFGEYLADRGETDPRLTALFNELLEEVYAPD
ncbi:MAG: exonuclease SbcCD subunit D [Acidobacteria bacterium]|nr:MAG: exonuclease SbcCD subunit D [Acidobacteriota bacterium]